MEKVHRFFFPTSIYCGPDAIKSALETLNSDQYEINGRGLLVTDQGLLNTEIPSEVVSIFQKAGYGLDLFSEVATNPDDRMVQKGSLAYRDSKASWIVGLGGGSALDVAKAIALSLNHNRPLEDYDDLINGDKLIVNKLPPVIAIPTTAGTGSEVSRSAVIHIHAVNRKVVIFSPRLMPTIAILDPSLTLSLPRDITAHTGLDALTHLIESFIAKNYHPMADGIALEGIRIVFEKLPVVLREGKNLEARQDMLMAAMMGAVAFQKGLGAAHSMAHALSAICGLHHGLANAIVLAPVLEHNRNEIGERKINQLSQIVSPEGAVGFETFMIKLRELLLTCDIPLYLSDVGVKEKDILNLSNLALRDGSHHSNPRPMSTSDFQWLFRDIL